MATEQNEQAQEFEQEQAEKDIAQTQAESEQAEVSVESLQEQIAQLEGDLKLEKARTANAVYEAQKSVERIQRESEKHKDTVLENSPKSFWIRLIILSAQLMLRMKKNLLCLRASNLP